MSIKEADLDFNNHINFIVGNPGTGKSAVFEAINICLSDEKRSKAYSEYVQQGKDQAIIKLQCLINNKEANFDVKLNCVSGSPFEGQLSYDGKEYKGSSKISEFLKGLELDYYLRIMFSMQNKENIVDLSPAVRLDRLQKLFDCDFSEQKDTLSKALKDEKEKLAKLKSEKDQNLVLINELKTLETKRRNICSQDEYVETLKQISADKDKIAELKEQITKSSAAASECTALETQISSTKKLIIEKSSLEDGLKNAIKDSEEQERLIDDIIEIKNKNISKVGDIENSINFNTKEKEEADKSIRELENILQGCDYELNDLTQKKSLIDQGICPHCGQPTHDLFPDIDDKISEVNRRKEELNTNLKIFREKNLEFAGLLTQLNSDLNTAKRELNNDEINLNRVRDHKTFIDNNIKGYYTKIEAFKDKDLDSDLKALEQKLENTKKNIVDSTTISEECRLIETSLEALQKKSREYEMIEQSNKEVDERNATRLERADALSKRTDEIDKSCLELQTEIDVDTESYNFFNKVFPQYISKVNSDNLTVTINNFIHSVFPNFDVKLVNTDKGCELKYTKDRTLTDQKRNDKLNGKMSSGFERSVLDLSFKVSLAQGFGLDLFIGDEVDGACGDDFAVELIKEVLNKENFKQVFIISHKPKLVERISEIFEDCNIYETNSGTFKKRDN